MREVRCVLAEVAERRRLGTVESIAEVHLVEIQLENLILRVGALELCGDEHLLDLARERLVGRQETLPGELLGDRASALRPAPLPEVGENRAEHAHRIHAPVIVEPLVLHGHQRAHEVRRNLLQRNLDPLLLVDGERRPIRGIEQRRGLRHVADPAQALAVGQVARKAPGEPAHGRRGHPYGEGDHRDGGDERARALFHGPGGRGGRGDLRISASE